VSSRSPFSLLFFLAAASFLIQNGETSSIKNDELKLQLITRIKQNGDKSRVEAVRSVDDFRKLQLDLLTKRNSACPSLNQGSLFRRSGSSSNSTNANSASSKYERFKDEMTSPSGNVASLASQFDKLVRHNYKMCKECFFYENREESLKVNIFENVSFFY
jgi:hypothetical protein